MAPSVGRADRQAAPGSRTVFVAGVHARYVSGTGVRRSDDGSAMTRQTMTSTILKVAGAFLLVMIGAAALAIAAPAVVALL